MRRIIANCSKWILPILFIGYYCCVSFYAHIHTENGEVILHSHPFHKQNKASHEHNSKEEIILFHTLSTIHVADGAVQAIQIEKQIQISQTILSSKDSPDLLCAASGKFTTRGPPFA